MQAVVESREKQKVKAKFALDPEEVVFKSSTEVFDRIDHSRIIQTFIDLVKIPSPSGEEYEIRNYILGRLQALNIPYRVDRVGNIIAFKKGMLVKPKTILLNAHMDTVGPCTKVNPVIGDDEISSDGTSILGADDKAGITAILEALEVLSRVNQFKYDNLRIIFTVSEEDGLKGAKALTLADIEADFGYVFDCNGDVGTIIHKGPTQEKFKLNILGQAAHAGLSPEKGVNAIAAAALAISNIKQGKLDPETTVNIGKISGGRSTNIISDRVEIEGEIRSHQEETIEQLKSEIEGHIKKATKLHKAEYELTWERLISKVYLSQKSNVIETAVRSANALGIPANVLGSNGASDACVFNELGVPTSVIAVGYEKAHSLNESIRISSLVRTTAMIIEILHQAAGFQYEA